jgi:hypothetical protein
LLIPSSAEARSYRLATKFWLRSGRRHGDITSQRLGSAPETLAAVLGELCRHERLDTIEAEGLLALAFTWPRDKPRGRALLRPFVLPG